MAILETLKRQTSESRARIEELIPVPSDGFASVKEVVALERLYGFCMPFEATVARVAGIDRVLPDWLLRRRLPALEGDLLILGDTRDYLARLPVCAELPPIDSLATAMGAMYVSEESPICNLLLFLRYLANSFKGNSELNVAFLVGYRREMHARWNTFQQALVGMATVHNEPVIVRSAINTFRTLEAWLSEDPRRVPRSGSGRQVSSGSGYRQFRADLPASYVSDRAH